MKHVKTALALLLAAFLALGLFSGCGTEPAGESPAPPPSEAAEEPPTGEGAGLSAEPEGTRTLTDMAGREVEVPAVIEKAFSTDPTAAVFLYTLVPDRMLGWNYELNDLEKSIILDEYETLPNFGMGDAINYEAVLAAGPDIAFMVGTINDAVVSDADAMQESLGIPVVVVDSELSHTPEAYRFMGELFGVEETAEQLAAYAERTLDDIANMDIPEGDKVRMYYGNGEDSLETAPAGSSHGAIIELVNAVNVADLELGDGGRVQISAEQLLAWDPDVIVVNGEPKSDIPGASAADAILSDPAYATLTAVQEGRVYGTPNAPFSWVDRPPGPNRIVGMRWLSGLKKQQKQPPQHTAARTT